MSNSEITLKTGLNELRLFNLKTTQEPKVIIGLVALQITDLLQFLGMQDKMNAKQIFDTAEFIYTDFEFFSLRGLQHCFNMIKRKEYPFDVPLYNQISGVKILGFLQQYDKYVDEQLFAEANSKIYSDTFRAYDKPKTNLAGIAGAMSELKQSVKNRNLKNT